MSEKEFTDDLVSRLKPLLEPYRIESSVPLLYSITVDESGNIQLGLNEEGKPKRGGGTGFEQDILIYEEVGGQTKIAPCVAIEVKFQSVTTHDALVYSEKARRIRNIYPYLRYGLLLGDMDKIPPRALRLGVEFDFILCVSSTLAPNELEELARLLKSECEISRRLSQAFAGKAKVTKLTKNWNIDIGGDQGRPPNKPNMAIEPAKISEVIGTQMGLSKPTFYVYENWQAENKARVHRGECAFCNYGKGNHPGAGRKHGRWHGPFKTFHEAEDCALKKRVEKSNIARNALLNK